MSSSQQTTLANEEYTVGWICALPVELAAAKGMLDEVHGEPKTSPGEADNNIYVLGSMGRLKVAVACLPMHQLGSFSAAAVAKEMLFTFPRIRVGLLVGIGAGIPGADDDADIRLGDVVIGSHPRSGGVVVYDFGKRLPDGSFDSLSALNRPPRSLGAALGKLKAEHEMQDNQILLNIEDMLQRFPLMRKRGYTYPGQSFDQLFDPEYPHIAGQRSCSRCDLSKQVPRQTRLDETPVIHYGTIASGNMVIKDSSLREEIREKYGAICLEMEAAGLMNNFPCIVIRGISDYADSHKNDHWRPFAAASAAACAKELLTHVQPKNVDVEPTAKDILAQVHGEISGLKSLWERMDATRISGQIRRWLKAPDPTVNHNAACRKQFEGTGMWFIKGNCFEGWLKEPNSLLWINGFAGCGKSILCSTAIEHVFREAWSDQTTGVAFFYFDFKDTAKQNESGLLRSILLQLSQQLSGGEQYLEQLYNSYQSGAIPTPVLLGCLKKIIKEFCNVYILLDALDESPRYREREHVLSLLRSIREWHMPNLHLLATSRDELDIRESLNPTSGQHVLMKNSGVDYDILRFVSHQLETEPRLQRWRGCHSEIKDALVERAQGIFRYVECQFNALKRARNRNHLDACLNSLPRDLDETYERILCSIEELYVTDVRRILTLLCFNRRSLTVEELIHAHAVDLGNDPCLDLNGRMLQDSDVRDMCLGLVEISPAKRLKTEILTVHLAHYSVQEYLVSDRIERQNAANFKLNPGPSHSEILRTCLAYLLEPQLSRSESKDTIHQDFPLSEYAATSWFHHYKNSMDGDCNARKLILRLFNDNNGDFARRLLNVPALYYHHRISRKPHDIPSPIHIVSFLGLEWVLQSLFESTHHHTLFTCELVNARGGRYGFALQAASCMGHWKIVEMLLDHGADVNAQGGVYGSALTAASCHGHAKIVQMLIERGANVNAPRTMDTSSALYCASKHGHENVVRMLLTHGADPHSEGDNLGWVQGLCALQVAAEKGNESIVVLLLQHGANVNLRTLRGSTALNLASARGHESLVRTLLRHGADVNADANSEVGGLRLAYTNDHKKITSILISHGADINASGILSIACHKGDSDMAKTLLTSGYVSANALHAACDGGHESTVQLLLDYAVDVNAVPEWRLEKKTALHIAAERGNERILQLLLDHGANINAVIPYYGSVLQTLHLHNARVTAWLISHGADVNIGGGKYGSALQEASSIGALEAARILLDHGALIDYRGGKFCTALEAAAYRGHSDILQMLLDRGASFNIYGGKFENALYAASCGGHVKAVQILLDRGVDVNISGGVYGSPIGVASQQGHEKTVQILLARGANPNKSRSRAYGSALYIASRKENPAIVRMLLEHGADVNEVGDFGTPLTLSSFEGHADTVRVLLDHGADASFRLEYFGNLMNSLDLALSRGHEVIAQMLRDHVKVNTHPGRQTIL